VPANLLLSLAVRFLQRSLQLLLVRRFAGLTEIRQNGEIPVDLINRRLPVVRLFDAQPLPFLLIDGQRFERTNFTTTHDGLQHGFVLAEFGRATPLFYPLTAIVA
jgi:hypothetical protein